VNDIQHLSDDCEAHSILKRWVLTERDVYNWVKRKCQHLAVEPNGEAERGAKISGFRILVSWRTADRLAGKAMAEHLLMRLFRLPSRCREEKGKKKSDGGPKQRALRCQPTRCFRFHPTSRLTRQPRRHTSRRKPLAKNYGCCSSTVIAKSKISRCI
jgi:hypothetical protein